ncbi:Monoterepene synthase TPS1, chloropastic [Dirofilaria immitis]
MPYYMVLLFNRMIKWLPKPDNSGTMSGRKITCRRLDYWSRRIEHKDFECTLHHRVDSRWYVWLRSIEGARPVRVKKVTICYTLESGCLRLQPKEGGKPHLRLNMTTRPIANKAEVERICWDPKDGELYLSRMKPEETLVEVRSDSDVQIDRLTLV